MGLLQTEIEFVERAPDINVYCVASKLESRSNHILTSDLPQTMKIILTGSSGFIGASVLTHCLSNPSVTSIVALSRKPLAVTHPKLTTIIHDDFTSYPASLLSQLEGAEACIYTLGTVKIFTDPDFNRRVNRDFTLAAVEAFATLAGKGTATPFRFVYCSGCLVEKDPAKRLWFMAENRKMRGTIELDLLRIGEEHVAANHGFEVYITRAGMVVAPDAWLTLKVLGPLTKVINVDDLGNAFVRIAVEGGGEKRMWENEDLVRLGGGSGLEEGKGSSQ